MANKVVKKAAEVKTTADMQTELVSMQADLLEARRGHKAGELANPRVISATRKQIARLKTAIRSSELAEKTRQSTGQEDK